MLCELARFYHNAPLDLQKMCAKSLGEYLDAGRYGAAFREDHLYPMAAAIWSTPSLDVKHMPAAAFVRFCENHGLLKLANRPLWRTVTGGSQVYIDRLTARFRSKILLATGVERVRRLDTGVVVRDATGIETRFDHVVVATHANQALALLEDPSPEESRLLGAFGYSRNEAFLHTDATFMPRRKAAWSSWNYLAESAAEPASMSVTYWMNRLQPLGDAPPVFVTLNPRRPPRDDAILARDVYDHPVLDGGAARAQEQLWSLQGERRTWFCGAHFGAGFHEDGLQAGLAVAEDLGGKRRPWIVPDDSGRIARRPPPAAPALERAA
jgi:predicted NAD/FAD-binding protein